MGIRIWLYGKSINFTYDGVLAGMWFAAMLLNTASICIGFLRDGRAPAVPSALQIVNIGVLWYYAAKLGRGN